MTKHEPPVEITQFQRLLLTKIFQPSHIITAIEHFIHMELGPQFLHYSNPPLHFIYQDLQFNKPLLMLVQKGEDPMNYIIKMIKEMQIPQDLYYIISLGQGQAAAA